MAYSKAPCRQRPLRICLVVPYDLALQAGGVKQHALDLKSALERLGDKVTLVGPTSGAEKDITDPDNGIYAFSGVARVPINGTASSVGMFVSPARLIRFFRQQSFDVVHLQEPQVPTMPYSICWSQRNLAKVATFHAADETGSILWPRRLSGAMIFPTIQRAIAVSPTAAFRARQSWGKDVTIIPNGVDVSRFVPLSAEARAARPSEPLRLLHVGRLADTRKGARFVLQAFAQLQARGVPVTLEMVGQTAGWGTLPKLPGLTYSEQLSDAALAQRFRNADALVAAATGQESFGMILLEAMASGLPVVCTTTPGYLPVIRRQGAILAPPRDADALAQAIEKMALTSPAQRAKMGAGNHTYAQSFSWDTLVHRVRHEYWEAMQQMPGAKD